MLALCVPSHVGKYDRANGQPELAMLAIDIGPIIDRGLDDNCGPILAYYIVLAPRSLPIIGRELLPELSGRPFNL